MFEFYRVMFLVNSYGSHHNLENAKDVICNIYFFSFLSLQSFSALNDSGILTVTILSSEHSEVLVFFCATQSLHFIGRILLNKFLITPDLHPISEHAVKFLQQRHCLCFLKKQYDQSCSFQPKIIIAEWNPMIYVACVMYSVSH